MKEASCMIDVSDEFDFIQTATITSLGAPLVVPKSYICDLNDDNALEERIDVLR